MSEWSECPRCFNGRYNGQECAVCWGTGRVTESLLTKAERAKGQGTMIAHEVLTVLYENRFGQKPDADILNRKRQHHDVIERVLIEQYFAGKSQGYTLETADKIAEALGFPVKDRNA